MTVITKNLGDKKSDNLKDPLVENIVVEDTNEGRKVDVEVGGYPVPPQTTTRYIISARVRPYYSLMLIIMLFLLVATCILGIFGTEYLYDQYKYIVGSEQKPAVYRAWGPWPYNNDDAAPEYRGKIPIHVQRMEETDQQRDVLSLLSSNMFQTNADDGYLKLESESEEQSKPFEEIKLDMDGNRYEKIELPSKTASRFVHDFQSNYTSIVDVANERCFIMPLDRSSILPPKSMFDLLFKMSNGYYSMDTEKIRHDMRVVMPALNDINAFGVYIKQECDGFASYKLEKFVGGVSAN